MTKCKKCGTELGEKVKYCLACKADQRNWFMRHKILTFIGVFLLIGVIGTAIKGGNKDSINTSSTTIETGTKVPAAAPKAEITLNKLIEKNPITTEGKKNKIYKTDLDCKNPDGSYVVLNIVSVKKYKEYKNNKGDAIKDVIVIENVTPLDQTRNFVSNASFFQAFDKYGVERTVGDIFTQSGKEYSEIIFSAGDNVDDLKYITIGGFDKNTNNGKAAAIFEIE